MAFLLHSTGHRPAGSEIDASIVYADYYYLEALLRLKALQSGYQMAGPYEVVARDGQYARSKGGSERDMRAALDFAQKGESGEALRIINAYAHTLQRLDGHDAPLCAIQTYWLVRAMTLLKDRQTPEWGAMIRRALVPMMNKFEADSPYANGNWGAIVNRLRMACGIFLDDKALYKEAVDYFLHANDNGSLPNYVSATGQCQETGRDQGHAQLGLGAQAEYHRMHKYGTDARQVLNDENLGHVAWTSTDPDTGNRYLALFQRDNTRWIVGSKALYRSEVVSYTTDGHAVDVDIDWPEGEKSLVLVVDDGGDNFNYDHGDWINPTLVLRDGTEVELTGTYKTRQFTNSYFNRVYENKNVDNGGKMKVMGVSYDRGFSTDANAAIFFEIPEELDVVRFKAKAAADDSGIGQQGATTSLRFMVFCQNPLTNEQDDSAARSGLISRTGTKSKMLEADVTGAEQLRIVRHGDRQGHTGQEHRFPDVR